ncbi:MAG: NAD(P)-dependent oxidoreductase [Coprobacillus sp.]
MKLQFFHIDDLCQFMDVILNKKPCQHIFNVGNKETISIYDWVTLCYKVAGKNVEFVNVSADIEQRNYFCFYDYEYYLDIYEQDKLMTHTKSLEEGLIESFEWYIQNTDKVNKKPFVEYIESNFIK